jgi:hypothetical protein
MLMKLADNQNASSWAAQLRRKRFLLFQSLLASVERPVRILDVGGTQRFWEVMGVAADDEVQVTLLNLTQQPVSAPSFISVAGNACQLQFGDGTFDIVFSNSVIEHVGGYDEQRQMAQEIKRVGKWYFLQTPNRNFPLEPHFLVPFFQFLPVATRVWLVRHFDVGWYKKIADPQQARELVESIRLLNKSELVRLFPEATLYEEKLLGLTKSYVVYGGWE